MTMVLAESLIQRLNQPLPGRRAQSRFEPESSNGRHFASPPPDCRQGAVVALLYAHEGVWHVPFTLRPESLTNHPGQVSLPGGMVEAGESAANAALRELEEELGIAADEVRLLGQLSPLYVFVSNFYVTPWIALTDHLPKWRPDPREVADVLEIPVAHLIDPDNFGRQQRRHGELVYTAPHIAWGRHRIWGATGMIVGELVELLREAETD